MYAYFFCKQSKYFVILSTNQFTIETPINTNVLLERFGCFHEKCSLLEFFSDYKMKDIQNHDDNTEYEKISECHTRDLSSQQG